MRDIRSDCPVTSPSNRFPGHEHACTGWHLDDGLHFCSTCPGGAWFYKLEDPCPT